MAHAYDILQYPFQLRKTHQDICVLCFFADETSYHLFLTFAFAKHLWRWLETRLQCSLDLSTIVAVLECIPTACSSQVRDFFCCGDHPHHPYYLEGQKYSSIQLECGTSILSLVALSGNMSHGYYLHGREDKIMLDNFNVSQVTIASRSLLRLNGRHPLLV